MNRQNLIPFVLAGGLIAGIPLAGSLVYADDTAQLKEQVQALQGRVDQLENQLANKQQAVGPTVRPAAAMPVYDQWEDPFQQMMLMRQQNIPYYLLGRPNTLADMDVFNPRMDMKKTPKQYIITMDIPGMDKDKINVEIKQGMLIISGERQSEVQDNKNNQYYRQERSFGSFMQAVPLPEDVKTDQIDANYKNGVLTVTVTVARKSKEEKGYQDEKIKVK